MFPERESRASLAEPRLNDSDPWGDTGMGFLWGNNLTLGLHPCAKEGEGLWMRWS